MRAAFGVGLLVLGAFAGVAGCGEASNNNASTQPAATKTAEAQHPNFSGTYRLRQGTDIRVEHSNEKYANDPAGIVKLNAAGQAAYEKNKAGVAASDPEIDTALKCQPLGIPRLLYPGPIVFQVMQTEEVIGVVGEWLAPARMVWMGDKHREGYYPTYMGDSIAHWEGKELVVDTVNFADTTFLDGEGFPHSDQMHVTERWSLSDDGKTIANKVTVEDPKYLEAPYTRTYYYDQFTDFNPTENVCENTRTTPQDKNR